MSKKFVARKSIAVRAGAIVAAVALGATLGTGVAFADEVALNDAILDSITPGLHTDYVSESASLASSTYPSAFDLRHYNGTVTYNTGDSKSTISGGTNYVSEVKCQNPFGTCWAFSVTAAAETSMITSLDKNDNGVMDGSIDYDKAASGEAGTFAKSASNLSERHLAYFSFSHPTTYGIYSSQAGEGRYMLNGTTDVLSMMKLGGSQTLGLSVYTSGIGPVPESFAPYISDEGWLEVMALEIDKTSESGLRTVYVRSVEEGQRYYEENWTPEAIAAFNAETGSHLTKDSETISISAIGTWKVDSEKTYYALAELDNSNIIATNKDATTGKLTDEEMDQAKYELSEGHPLSIAYCADQSRPGQKLNGTKTYINTSTWAQYTYENAGATHAVTIVGWDDNYSKDNFTHNIYNANGTLNEEETAKTTPAGDGAWIVRNSWGSIDNSNPLYKNNWGVDGSGYFYLSYYDKSLAAMESYEFDVSSEAQARTQFYCYQHDLANISIVKSEAVDDAVKMCNVFDGPEVGETSVSIRDLGYMSSSTYATSTLEVYVMDDDADVATVINGGDYKAQVIDLSQDTAGYHRVHLDDAVIVRPGQKFAVVQTTQRDEGGQYEYSYGAGFSQSYAKSLGTLQQALGATPLLNDYTDTVINEGESLIYLNGTWLDWADVSEAIDQQQLAILKAQVAAEASQFRAQIAQLETQRGVAVYRLYNPETSEHLWTEDANEYAELPTYGWQQEDVAWRAPENGVGVYRLYNPVLGTHHYTSDSNEITVLTSTQGWVYDNDAKPVFYSAQEGSTASGVTPLAIYRMYNGALSQHLLTKDENEYGLLGTYGWMQEGVSFYALDTTKLDEQIASLANAAAADDAFNPDSQYAIDNWSIKAYGDDAVS